MTWNGVMALILRYFTKFVYDVAVKKFTFAISPPDDFWSPYVIGQTIYIFILWFVRLSFFFSSPNLSGRRLNVCHTSTHGVALVGI